jgi:hypothetical protein
MNDAEAALQGLLDKQAIAEVLYRYARACDRADEAMLRSCFLPGAPYRHGRFAGTASEFFALAMKIIGSTKLEKHQISNVLVELGGDVAFAESHYIAYHRRFNEQTGEEEDFFSGGRFLDRFERRDGSWLIAARVGLIDYERFEPPTERGFRQLTAAQKSQRLPADPVYELMPSLQRPRAPEVP